MNRRLLPALFALPLALVGLATPPVAAKSTTSAHVQTVVLAGGCFWGMEEVFEKVKGVTGVVAGYSGGSKETAQYETVSSGRTGHAESVAVSYDPSRISYAQLLDVYFSVAHDPTQVNRQGPDAGTQYRSVIFYANDAQRREAAAYIARLSAQKKFARPIATQVVALHGFYAAEAYHQHFADRNPTYPYIVFVDAPKVADLREHFPQLVKPGAN